MKIYLDNCCYNRPFDDQTQERIHLESEAILDILRKGQIGGYETVGSDVLELEMEHIRDDEKKLRVKELYKVSNVRVSYTDEIRSRSMEIKVQSKIKTFDSLHIAAAEAIGADVILTTDMRLERMAGKLDLSVRIMNPVAFMKRGDLNDEHQFE